MTTPALPKRADLDQSSTWAIEKIFASAPDWEAEFSRVEDELPGLSAYANRLNDPAIVAGFFAAREALGNRAAKLLIYASMSASVDAGDTQASARRDRAQGLSSRFAAVTAFAEPELLALPAGTLKGWAGTPELNTYAHFFANLERLRLHVRGAEVEELLGLVRSPFTAARTIHPTLVNADLNLGTAGGVKIGHGNIDRLTASPDRELRKEAWEAYADAHLSVQHAEAACLLTGVRADVFLARARRYDSSLQAALSPYNLPESVFHTLIETYRANLPTWHRYFRVRARWLGLDKLREYDVKAPLSRGAPTVPYERAVEWIAQGMAPLGRDYVDAMTSGLTGERWVDIYPNQGKRQGAYSTGTVGTPPYIFMSYGDSLQGLSTLAHEVGHSMHKLLTTREQPPIYANYSLFSAEVASNFNQAMVRRHLFAAQPDPDFQIALIEEALGNFHRYFFVMPTLARFELDIHGWVERGLSLSAPELNAKMADLLAEGYGDAVELDHERSGITWAQFSTHLYSNFYVWQYATGISAAHQLLAGFDADPDAAQERYLGFLGAGSSKYPLSALEDAGVDMRTGEAVEKTFQVLAGYVDRLEALVDARA